MNASTRLLHVLLARGDYLEEFTRAELMRLLPILEAAHEAVVGKIAATGGAWTRELLDDLAADLDEIYSEVSAQAYGEIRGDLEQLAIDEGAWIGMEADGIAIGISFSAASPSLLRAVLDIPTSIGGSTLGQLFEALGVNSREAAYNAIAAGTLAGDTVHEMTVRFRGRVVTPAYYRNLETGKRIVGVSKRKLKTLVKKGTAGYVPGVYEGGVVEDVSTRQAEALARTATMHVANQSREIFYKANEDLIKGYQRYETLDAVTCMPCGVEDGHEYRLDEPRPALPAHPSCRGGYVPTLKSWRELGYNADELPESTRASMDGQVAESTTWADKVAEAAKSGNVERLKAMLGPSRAALYQQGVKLEDMVVDGRVVPLKDLTADRKRRAA